MLRRLIFFAVVAFWSFGLWALSSVSTLPADHVVLISIDGLAAFHLENRHLELPNIRGLISRGVWAEGVEGVFPSVTHPSHTTILTGVLPRFHGVIGNRMTNRLTGQNFHVTNLPRSESVRVSTILDAAKKKGLSTASFFWPENWQDPSVDFNIPEVFNEDSRADIRAADPKFLEELRRADVPIDLYYRWYGGENLQGAADAILTQAAANVLQTHRVNLMVIHLLATDVIQHAYGANHYLSKSALTNADYCVGLLEQAAEKAGIAGRTTFVVTADHGFHTVNYDLNIQPLFDPLGNKVRLHAEGWTAFVELGESFDAAKDESALEAAFKKALGLAGVRRIVRPEEFHGLGYPTYEENPHVRGQFMIVADIDTHLVAQGPPLRRAPKPTPYHGHGYLPSHPNMRPAFVAAGAGIRKGVRIGLIRQTDLAPTISLLLGLETVGDPDRAVKEALSF